MYSARLKLARSVRMIKLPNIRPKLYCFDIFTVSGIWFYFEILNVEWKAFYLVPLNHKHSILTSNPNNIYGFTMLSFAFYEHFFTRKFPFVYLKSINLAVALLERKPLKDFVKWTKSFYSSLTFFILFFIQLYQRNVRYLFGLNNEL